MPPRVMNGNTAGTGARGWYESLPPITRAYATILFGMTIASYFKLFNPYWLALLWPRVFSHFEVWRLVTNFFFAGAPSLPLLFKFIWLIQYGTILETQTFQFQPADFLYMLIFGAAVVLVLSGPLISLGVPLVFNATTLIFMVIYVWSRQFPDQQVSIYGLFNIMSFYVPFFFAAIEFFVKGMPWGFMVGIVVGHVYVYLTVIYPAMGGRNLLVTPAYLKNLLANYGIGRRVVTHAATGQDAFRAFQGRGMRLGAN